MSTLTLGFEILAGAAALVFAIAVIWLGLGPRDRK